MGDRFYEQQLAAIGTCPGKSNKRRRRMAWDDEKKQQVIASYQDAEPTPENSMEIVQEIAEEVGETPNGVRMVLSKAGVYVKKATSNGGTKKEKASGDKPARKSKEDSINELREAIEAIGAEVDEDIITKLTGKAAIYFTGVLASK